MHEATMSLRGPRRQHFKFQKMPISVSISELQKMEKTLSAQQQYSVKERGKFQSKSLHSKIK